MKHEKSTGAVIFRRENDNIIYLLLNYEHKSKYLGFPRGSVEQGESEKQAATREIKEETGLTPLRLWVLPKINSFYSSEDDCIFMIPVFAAEVNIDDKIEILLEKGKLNCNVIGKL